MQNQKNPWPLPRFNQDDEPHFLFIVTPPYSGSTALAEFLNSSHRTMILQDNGEGQWLIPGLCGKDRWDPNKRVNYESIKAVWLNRYQNIKRLVKNVDVVIEKSPPNMMRIEALSSQFKSCSFMANNRNPYANCASVFYRHYDVLNMSLEDRADTLVSITNDWLNRSAVIKNLVGRLKIPLVTYEAFCQEPASVIRALETPIGVAESVDVNTRVKVKDYPVQGIINQNPKQISKLKDSEINLLTEILAEHKELLAFFGYELL